MPTLLKIPLEVRFRILELVIVPRDAPENHSAAGKRVATEDGRLPDYRGGTNVMYSAEMGRTDAWAVLLVNRQLNAEAKCVLQFGTPKAYKLDVMIVDGSQLWPTWLSIPVLAHNLDKIYTQFRIDPTSQRTRIGWRHRSASAPNIVWRFLTILNRFCMFGPTGNISTRDEERFSVKILELDFISPDVPDHELVSEEGLLDRYHRTEVDKVLPADWVAGFIQDEITFMLRRIQSYYNTGSILYRRTSTIRILVDGVLRHEWNVAQELKDLPPQEIGVVNNPLRVTQGRDHEAIFEIWKTQILEERRQLGLEVL